MTSPSRLSVLEDGLLSLLLSDVTLAGIKGPPQLAEPQSADLKSEHVWIYEKVETTYDFDVTGNQGGSKQELVTFLVGVSVVKADPATATGQAAWKSKRDRCDVLSGIVEQLVRSNAEGSKAVPVRPWVFAEVTKTQRYRGTWDKATGVLRVLHVVCEAEGL